MSTSRNKRRKIRKQLRKKYSSNKLEKAYNTYVIIYLNKEPKKNRGKHESGIKNKSI